MGAEALKIHLKGNRKDSKNSEHMKICENVYTWKTQSNNAFQN